MFAGNVKLIGNHPKFIKAIEHAQNLAVTKAPVLVTGEFGVGKETLCRYIHQNSSRHSGPFIVVDCARETQEVENEILGHRDEETGRFNRGALESANGGTVMLKNIDVLDENFQKRLYTILQELSDYDLDIRLMASTTKNLSKYVGAGRFQRSLYVLFSNSQINLIPLRERGTDINLLMEYFVSSWCSENEVETKTIALDAVEKMQGYYWTHNLTELRSVIRNTLENMEGTQIDISAIELGEKKVESVSHDVDDDGLKLMSLKDAEKLLIKKALMHTSENRTQAAKILGVSIRTLRNKINEYRTEGNNYFVNLR